MSQNCPICDQETTVERRIHGIQRVTDYVCENCSIVWYLNENERMQITVSSTHSRASKLSDVEFERLLKRIADYEGS